MEPKILFVTMPWATPVHPSLALGLLNSILDLAGIESECLYGNLLVPRPEQRSVFTFEGPGLYEDRSAGLSFVPHLYPHVEAEGIANTVAERFMWIMSREGQLEVDNSSWSGLDDATLHKLLIEQTLFDIRAAEICLNRCLEKIERGNYDIVGFSLTFETQLIASLALAGQIKQRLPGTRIVFGGAACVSSQGIALIKSYDYIDAVCFGEGDALIVPLVKALRGEVDLKSIKGIAYRSGGRLHVNEKAPAIADLDWIPTPNYDWYFDQKKNSEWLDTMNVLLFETSRGCWWGEKHLCTFCGLNAETLTYRSKSAHRVMQEISTICQRWDVRHGLQAVDNIFDMRYFKELVPLLIEFQRQRDKPVGIFFEIKSNLKLSHLFQLAAAGITTLQPGIESFSDHILKLMDKGTNALQQVSFIKWANQVGIRTTYNILMRNPGETVEDYREMIQLLPYLTHLQSPHGMANVQLERYSPYFLQPEKFNMRNVRPQLHYKEMFPDPNVDIGQLVYQFEFDHDELDGPEMVALRREFTMGVLNWQVTYKPHRLDYYVQGHDVVIVDRRNGDERTERLRGLQAKIFLFVNQPRPFSAVACNFADVAPSSLRSFLEWLVSMRFVYHHKNDQYLAMPIRVYTRSEFCDEMNKEVDDLMSRLPTKENAPHRLPVFSVA